MITFNFDITCLSYILFGVTALSAIFASTVGLRYIRVLVRAGRKLNEPSCEDITVSKLPRLSVVVYTKNAEGHITSFIEGMYAQQYPDFEVIVVNDASVDNTREIVETLMNRYPKLKLTFVPDSARNVSRRKTAYTLGIKASDGEVVLLTASNCRIPSEQWLSLMAAPFINKYTEVTIGSSRVSPDTNSAPRHSYRSFDNLTTTAQWLGAALAGTPYRGDTMNLAFRRQLFFDHKGFATSNPFKAGEDDIFVNEIATPSNTVAVIYPEATPDVFWESGEYPRLWLEDKERHAFTSRYLHTWALRRQGFNSLCTWISLSCAIATAIAAFPNLLPGVGALIVLLLFWSYQICVYRRAAHFMRSEMLRVRVPLFWLIRPLANARYRMRVHNDKSKNYTWQRSK